MHIMPHAHARAYAHHGPHQVDFDPLELARQSDGFSAARIQTCLWRAAGDAAMADEETGSSGALAEATPEPAALEVKAEATAEASAEAKPESKPEAGRAAVSALRQADLLRAIREEKEKEEGRHRRMMSSMLS